MLTRRAYIGSLAAPLLRAAQPTRILDAHTHFYNPGRPQGVPWPPKSDLQLYRRVMPDEFVRLTWAHGIRGTVVIEASAWLEDNQWILDLAKEQKIIKAFIGHLNPGTPEFAAHLERFGKNPLFRGIRLNDTAISKGLPDPAFRKDMERLAGAHMVLDAIGGPTMYSAVLGLVKMVPNLPVILDHLPVDGGEDVLKKLADAQQVYAKVSGVLRKNVTDYTPMLDKLWDVFGPERVVYASNWPVSDKMAPYSVVLKVVKDYCETKPLEDVEKFFWENGAKFYGVSAR